MTGHVRKRGKVWSFVVDLDGQRAQRCETCGNRHWLERERAASSCTRCDGELGLPHVERRQVWRSGFTTKKAASEAMRALLARASAGRDPFPADVTLHQYVDRWFDSERVRDLRPHTVNRYRQVLLDYLLPDLGAMKLADVRPRHIRPVLDEMAKLGLSGRSLNEAKNILSRVFRSALEDELVDVNPVSAVRARSHRRRPLETPTTDQLRTLLRTATGTVWEMPLALAVHLGMRRSEVLGLRWSDIDLDAKTLRVQRGLQRVRVKDGRSSLEFLDVKTESSRRQIELGPKLVARLKRHGTAQAERRLFIGPDWIDGDLVCDRGDGGPLDPDAMTRATKRFVAKAGLPARLRLHDVRHGVATAMLANGVDTKIASAVLGHSSAAFTADQYQHVLRGMTSSAITAIDNALG
jgi:integrase